MTVRPLKSWKSGHCNVGNPPEIHRQCDQHPRPDGVPCTCWCHWEPQPTKDGAPVTTATHDGLVYDLPEAEYHADRTTLSVSGAKLLLKAPELFRWHQDHPVFKDVFDFGTAAHKMVLGVGAELVVHDYDPKKVKSPKSTNAWKDQQTEVRARGAVLLLPSEHATVQAMAEKLSKHKTAMELLSGGHAEVSAYADHPDGLRMRCRYDYLGDGYGVDYKSTVSSEPTAFAKTVANLGYDQQDDWYRHVAELAGRPIEAFHFIAQEKEPPYLVEVYELDDDFLARGRARNDRARQIFIECTATGDWSRGYTGQPFSTLSPPSWTRYESAATVPAGIPADFTWSLNEYA